MDFNNVPGLKQIFEENNFATNPFNELETEAQQIAYYKDKFNLKVTTGLLLSGRSLFVQTYTWVITPSSSLWKGVVDRREEEII